MARFSGKIAGWLAFWAARLLSRGGRGRDLEAYAEAFGERAAAEDAGEP